jgi:hypothetical protein
MRERERISDIRHGRKVMFGSRSRNEDPPLSPAWDGFLWVTGLGKVGNMNFT